ncbi:hypothetical protein OSG_eHP42_00065 [environmental Halophage eHP-42]|nr:hypothetical protein OSG_eHP42_00065 [environmental Halophage eHP-42]
MTVRIQSGTTVFVNNGQTVQTPTMRNAGTITNAGTTQEFRSNVASGSGSGLGTTRLFTTTTRASGIGQAVGAARTSPIPFPRASGSGAGLGTAKSFPPNARASGIGDAVGTAIDTRVKTVSAGADPRPDIQVNRLSTREIERDETVRAIEIRNAGTITNAGTTQVSQLPVGLTIGLVINSSSTRGIERDEISQAVKIRNAGTVTNAGTTRVSQTPPRQGIGEGVGTARTSPIPFSKAAGLGEGFGTATAQPDTDAVASGIGQAVGAARTSPIPFPRASGSGAGLGTARTSPIPFPRASGIGEGFGTAVENPIRNISAGVFSPERLQVNTNDIQDIRNDKIISRVEVQNAGTVRNEGTTQVSQTPSQPKDGIGEMFGQATTSRLTDRQASGFSEGLGTARTSPIPFPRASGRGSGLGTAQAQEKRLKTASGFGASSGKSIPLTLFDPIGHMATILSNITKSEVRLPKPERIAPIWEYSHNDRVNFPDPAVYFMHQLSHRLINSQLMETQRIRQTQLRS